MKNLIKYLSIILLVFTYSCELTNVPKSKKQSHSLLFNLVVGQENQKFYVYRVVESEDVYASYIEKKEDRYFEKNANITLHNSNINFSSFGVQDTGSFKRSFYYSSTEPLELFANTKYDISITINDTNITGETITPGNFNIISPTSNSTIKLNLSKEEKELNIKWEKSNSAEGYIIKTLHKYMQQNWNDTTIYTERISKDSFVTRDTSFNFVSYLHKGSITIDILAYDKNYHNHFVEFMQSSGVEGGYGYFGSSVLKTVTAKIE